MAGLWEWEGRMIGKSYFERQARSLLRLSQSVKDPELSTKLVAKAADLEERATDAPDPSPLLLTPALKDQTG